MEALKAIYEEDFRIVNEREKSLRVTIRSDDHSLSLDLLVRASLRGREGERERGERESGVREVASYPGPGYEAMIVAQSNCMGRGVGR